MRNAVNPKMIVEKVSGNQSEPNMPELIKPHTADAGKVPSGMDSAKKYLAGK